VRDLEGDGVSIREIEFSPDGSLLAAAAEDGAVRVWRVSDASLVYTLEGHSETVYGINFSPDGSMLASASEDKTIGLWQMSDGSLLRTLEGHEYGVSDVAFFTGRLAAGSASQDTTVRLWQVSDGSQLAVLEGFLRDCAERLSPRTVSCWRQARRMVPSAFGGQRGAERCAVDSSSQLCRKSSSMLRDSVLAAFRIQPAGILVCCPGAGIERLRRAGQPAAAVGALQHLPARQCRSRIPLSHPRPTPLPTDTCADLPPAPTATLTPSILPPEYAAILSRALQVPGGFLSSANQLHRETGLYGPACPAQTT
jgi:WD40 repeat protein